jgi:hypothetical protein
MKYTLSTVAVTTLLLAGGSLATLSAQHNHGGMPNPGTEATSMTAKAMPDQFLKVGKRGEISLSTETQVGDVLLKPGKYTLQHRVEGADHVLHFAAQSSKNQSADVRCTLEPLEKKAPTTMMRLQNTGASMRLVQVQIGGENVAHVL